MRKIFCFIDHERNVDGELKLLIEELDSRGEEIYLYTDIDSKVNDPENIMSEIDKNIRNNDNSSLCFLSNMESLFLIIYRLYHQMFDQFIYYRQTGADYTLTGVYQRLLLLPVSEAELLQKTVYSNSVEKLSISNRECNIKNLRLFLSEYADSDAASRKAVRKYYDIDGYYYLFEPILTEKKIVIHDLQKKNCMKFIFPGIGKMRYMVNCNLKLLYELFTCFDNILNNTEKKIYQLFDKLAQELKNSSFLTFNMTCSILDDAAQLDHMEDIIRSVALFSFLMKITKKPYYINQLLENTIEDKYLNCSNKYFVFNQCKRYWFTNEISADKISGKLLGKLYYTAFEEYKKELEAELMPIPKNERDENTVIVFTIQFLSERHPPTKTALERCYTIGKLLHKKVILINTREQHSIAGGLLMYNPSYGNVMEEYNSLHSYQYKDLSIPFYQPGVKMPDINIIREILHEVRRIRPYFIFSIGNGSMTADLCGKIVPQIASAVVFSTLPTTAATFSVIGRKIPDVEWIQLLRRGYTRDNIVEGIFTFELRPKTKTVTRKILKVPDNSFLLVTVGTRLDADISDDFIEFVQNTFQWGTHIIFAGIFNNYEEYCRRYPKFKEHSTCLGYYNDILALMEICDLYVNPIRSGGGFSIVEAFHEGIPGVTVCCGDIATAAGEDFCVDNYKQMELLIKRYIEDKEFYTRMANKAREREKVLTDSKTAMSQILDKVIKNRLFF